MTTILECSACHKKYTWANNTYKEGVIYKCTCSVHFQQVFCPHCSTSIMWSNVTSSFEGRIIKCGKCTKSFQFICCPHCTQINLWQDANCRQARVYKCQKCTQPFQQISCAHCSHTRIFSTRLSKQGERLACTSCEKNYQFIRCPHCQKGNYWSNNVYTPGSLTSCHSCKQNFVYMRCPHSHCFADNFWTNPVNVTLDFSCSKCKRDMQIKPNRERKPPPSSFQPRMPRSRSQSNDREQKPRSSSVSHTKPDLLQQRAVSSADLTKSCDYFLECKEFVKHLRWPIQFFDMKQDRCYCENCYTKNQPNTLTVADASYVIPRQWAGFGLGVDPFRKDNIWDDWIVVYHGTTPIAAESILTHRQFLLPGDKLIDGTQLPIRPGHIPGKIHTYTSPSIRYASLEVYSTPRRFVSPRTLKRYLVQIVFQCKQKPGTFAIQGETVGSNGKRICPFISNNSIEYFSDQRATIVPYRLLIRLHVN